MDKRYEIFCLADRYFYDTPESLSERQESAGRGTGTDDVLPAARRDVPAAWRRSRQADWLEHWPDRYAGRGTGAGAFPAQGWKVHVSACLENAARIADAVWDYCVPRGIPFKFVPSRTRLHLRNAKYAPRSGSGKFATLYPRSEEQLHTVLTELGAELAGEPGPYVLTDLRWDEGPLYVRYGGFTPRYLLSPEGTPVPAIEDPQGRLVPDRREPAFHVPEWVELPAFLQPHLDARAAATLRELPYRVERALHFSNGGGVYGGTDQRTGERVVLKEGRPHAGLAADGADAVARLEREKAALDALAGLDCAPGVRDWFTLDGHCFLVLDHLPGQPLNAFFAQRHPLLTAEPDPGAVAEYTRWALRIHRLVQEAVETVHAQGLVFNDLHLFNVMVAPDERSVALLDFEAAGRAADGARQVVAHPAFMAPSDRTGYDVDRYALACLRLALFVPMTTVLAVDRGKAAHLARIVERQFPDVPRDFLAEAVATIQGPAAAAERPAPATGARSTGPQPQSQPYEPPVALPDALDPAGWPGVRDALAGAVRASATPERDDRLFPGDLAQFEPGGGLGLAYGAAGVLHALAESGAGTYPDGEEWLLRHTDPPPRGTPLGLYDGLLGAALALDRLGHTKRAVELAGMVADERAGWDRLGPALYGGLAGIGLAFDELAARTGDTGLRDAADHAARLLADRAGDIGQRARGGLLYGASGEALFLLRHYERTAEPALLDSAATALRADLAKCRPGRAGTWLLEEGHQQLPYLGEGSVGVAAVLDEYARHAPVGEEFAAARAAILPAAKVRYCAQPGLFRGRAGLLLHLARTAAPGVTRAELAAQLDGLSWYAMDYRGHLAFPGEQLMRLSMDLATGTAGCLLAVAAAAARGSAASVPFLPFLSPPPAPAGRGGTETGPVEGP
ncbi:class III lanthionine synthetase LanKC [Streptomyces boncukensis]|uniref:Protein kinase/lanthionine synthetase C family protein n=1 Tax=Streptomyces boncukensis TaxID=2711219 RepID=A0A6G4X1A6_9ACTN|nr:class III lanthionine synthetase LanKC [Streptomyces boncukensis]NGO71168.1 protein kinase/lanthionine synthetase C family protein [Streptomyces boncukensis]